MGHIQTHDAQPITDVMRELIEAARQQLTDSNEGYSSCRYRGDYIDLRLLQYRRLGHENTTSQWYLKERRISRRALIARFS
jgi:hypothetical protein